MARGGPSRDALLVFIAALFLLVLMALMYLRGYV